LDASKAFDPYEIIGVITPGAVIALLLVLESPDFRRLLVDKGFSVGDLGLFVIVAFVLGHMVGAFGSFVQAIVFPLNGLPTNWVRSPSQTLVTAAQRSALETKVTAMEGIPVSLATVERRAWRAIMLRAYSRVQSVGRSLRIDVQNRTFGMARNLAAAFALSLAWYVVMHRDQTQAIALLTVLVVAAILRMRRSGVHYARALIVEFIDLDLPSKSASAPPS